MVSEQRRLLRALPPEAPLVASLGLLSGLAVFILATRILVSGRGVHFGLVWNLTLAWVPLVAALLVASCERRARHGGVAFLGSTAWLLFLPNAPYLITDLVHLSPRAGAPLWYDLILVSTFGVTGLALGLGSLRIMQSVVERRFGRVIGWLLVFVTVPIASFGMYLGRFHRFNSWHAATNPRGIIDVIIERVLNPSAHLRTFAFTGLFSGVLLALYLIFVSFVSMQSTPVPASPSRSSTS